MLKRIKQIVFNRKFLLVIAVLIVGALGYLTLTGHWINPLDKSLDFNISVASTTISKDKFIIVNGTLSNHTVHSYGAPWGTCAQQLAYYMDGKQIYSTGYGSMCAIGYGNIDPGEVLKQTFTVDPTNFSNGVHDFYVLYGDMKSNTLRLTLTSPSSTDSCYNLTQYASPLCSQISIATDVSDSSDKARCESYLNYLSQNTPLKPIVPLSSVSCVETDSAVPYIVVNVPKGDPDKWVSQLSNHFSYTNMPDGYASVTLVTYPN
jgi:hypothetical protein